MQPKNTTLLGKLFAKVRNERHWSRERALDDLWKRNGLEEVGRRTGYKIAETQMVHRDGTEVTEYRLYKLIDSSVVTVSAEIKSEVKTGLSALRENQHGSQTTE